MSPVFAYGFDEFDTRMTFREWAHWVEDPKNWRSMPSEKLWRRQEDTYQYGITVKQGGAVSVIVRVLRDGRLVTIGESEPLKNTHEFQEFIVPLFDRDIKGRVRVSGVTDKQQPTPDGKGFPIHSQVVQDLLERQRLGTEKYGEPLMANNGRDAMLDAYLELTDFLVYMRQELNEREQRENFLQEVIRRAATAELKAAQLQDELFETEQRLAAAEVSQANAVHKMGELGNKNRELEDKLGGFAIVQKRAAYVLRWALAHASTQQFNQFLDGNWSDTTPTPHELHVLFYKLSNVK